MDASRSDQRAAKLDRCEFLPPLALVARARGADRDRRRLAERFRLATASRARARRPRRQGRRPATRRPTQATSASTSSRPATASGRSPSETGIGSSARAAQPGPRPADAAAGHCVRLRQTAAARRVPAAAAAAGSRSRRCLAAPAPRRRRPPPSTQRPQPGCWSTPTTASGPRRPRSRHASRSPIASTTKLMTAYLARRSCRSRRARRRPTTRRCRPSRCSACEAGERISVRDLLYALILASANDAAVTLADGVRGLGPTLRGRDERRRASARPRRHGYTNPIGLDDPGNRSSAADLADLGDAAARRRFFRRSPTAETTIEPTRRDSINRNTLLRDDPRRDRGQDRHTLDAGYVLVGSATRDDVDLISVVLGAPSEAEPRRRDRSSSSTTASRLYRRRTPVAEGEALAGAGSRYQDGDLALSPRTTSGSTVRRDQQVATQVDAPDEVEGPIARASGSGRSRCRRRERGRLGRRSSPRPPGRPRDHARQAATRRSPGRGCSAGSRSIAVIALRADRRDPQAARAAHRQR